MYVSASYFRKVPTLPNRRSEEQRKHPGRFDAVRADTTSRVVSHIVARCRGTAAFVARTTMHIARLESGDCVDNVRVIAALYAVDLRPAGVRLWTTAVREHSSRHFQLNVD